MGNTLKGIDSISDSSGNPLNLGSGFASQDWVVIDQQTIVASTTNVDLGVDLFDPTLYEEIEITISGLQLDTGGEFHMQVSDDNGATFEAGTGYEWCWESNRADTGARQFGIAQGDADIELYSFIGTDSTDSTFIKIQAGAMDNSLDKTFSWQISRWITSLASSISGSGAFDGNTSNIDAFRFNSSADDVTVGLFTLRGRLKTGASVAGFNPDWEVIGQTNASGVTEVDFVFDPALFDEYHLSINSVVSSADSATIGLRISEDSGSTFKAGATDYAYAARIVNQAATLATRNADSDETYIAITDVIGFTAPENTSVDVYFKDLNNSLRKSFLFQAAMMDINTDVSYYRGQGAYVGTTNAINGIRVFEEGGDTLTSLITLRGRRKNPQIGTAIVAGTEIVLNRQVITTDTSEIAFTWDPTLYDYIVLKGMNIKPVVAGDGDELRYQISDDAGATYEAGTGYRWGDLRSDVAATPAQGDSGGTGVDHCTIYVAVGQAAEESSNFTLTLYAPDNGDAKYFRGDGIASNGSTALTHNTFGGWFNGNTNNIDGLRLYFHDGASTENDTAQGTFILSGARK